MRPIRLILFLSIFIPLSAACGLAQDRPVALRGTIVAADGLVPDGWIAFKEGRILSITAGKPALPGATYVETNGYIYPGLIDLHNHPMYAAFARWSPAETFENRYEWRNNAFYKIKVGVPARLLQGGEISFCDLNEYGEIRALIGGTTSIHGTSAQTFNPPMVPPCIKGSIRHLDWYSGLRGDTIGNERVLALLGVRDASAASMEDVKNRLAAGTLDRLLIHLAEGKLNDPLSREELDLLNKAGLLANKTSLIHGTALSDADLDRVAKSGASIIWSPRSNVSLYGQTEDIQRMLARNIPVAIAPDWPINGSVNLLGELRYARTLVPAKAASDEALLRMATTVPAQMVALQDDIGSLKQGARADLFVLQKSSSMPDAYFAVTHASPQDVTLVVVNGRAFFGARDQVVSLLSRSDMVFQPLTVCGTERFLALPAGQVDLEKLRTRLAEQFRGMGIDLTPVSECE